MSVAQETPPQERAQPPSTAPRNGRWAGFLHLTSARMKELRREPEVVFWMFVFPLLLSFGLGIAFRNRPADATSIAIIPGPHAQQRKNEHPENHLDRKSTRLNSSHTSISYPFF